MSWEAIGAIGEGVGAVAVIATLVYLSLQLRQYASGINSATIQQNMIAFNQLNSLLAANPSLADVVARGNLDPDSLSYEGGLQYLWIMRSYLNLYENLFEQYRRGTCPREFWMKNALELKEIAGTPGVRRFREQNRYHDELFRCVEQMNESQANVVSFEMKRSA